MLQQNEKFRHTNIWDLCFQSMLREVDFFQLIIDEALQKLLLSKNNLALVVLPHGFPHWWISPISTSTYILSFDINTENYLKTLSQNQWPALNSYILTYLDTKTTDCNLQCSVTWSSSTMFLNQNKKVQPWKITN